MQQVRYTALFCGIDLPLAATCLPQCGQEHIRGLWVVCEYHNGGRLDRVDNHRGYISEVLLWTEGPENFAPRYVLITLLGSTD